MTPPLSILATPEPELVAFVSVHLLSSVAWVVCSKKGPSNNKYMTPQLLELSRLLPKPSTI